MFATFEAVAAAGRQQREIEYRQKEQARRDEMAREMAAISNRLDRRKGKRQIDWAQHRAVFEEYQHLSCPALATLLSEQLGMHIEHSTVGQVRKRLGLPSPFQFPQKN